MEKQHTIHLQQMYSADTNDNDFEESFIIEIRDFVFSTDM